MSPLDRRVRVLLVEDSALVRKDLTALLAAEPSIEVVGAAMDPYIARDMILRLEPDVLLMDIGLPRLDGLSFLRAIMQHRPMPVIIISGLASPDSDVETAALEAGAFDVFHKPQGVLSIKGLSEELNAKILEAAQYSRAQLAASAPQSKPPPQTPKLSQPREYASVQSSRQVVLLGASTGGTEALREVLTRLPGDVPGICIVQHIPASFSRPFADRLNALCEFEVREAADGDELHAGLALVAPGGQHMTLHWQSGAYRVRLNNGARVHHQRPSVDVLFDSAVTAAGANAVAALLTGMGRDGAESLKRLRDCGAATLAQDRASCVVFGMPQAAIQLGAAEQVVSLDQMPQAILNCLTRSTRPAGSPRVAVA